MSETRYEYRVRATLAGAQEPSYVHCKEDERRAQTEALMLETSGATDVEVEERAVVYGAWRNSAR